MKVNMTTRYSPKTHFCVYLLHHVSYCVMVIIVVYMGSVYTTTAALCRIALKSDYKSSFS